MAPAIGPILLALFALTAPAAIAQTPEADGKAVGDAFLAGRTDWLWQNMTPEMQAATGSAAALGQLRDGLTRDLGEQTEVMAERRRDQGGFDIYERDSRWSKSPVVLRMTVALDDGGRIAGFHIAPAPVAADSPHLDYRTRTPLRLPFDGDWSVVWGGRTTSENYHAADPGQRFATDFLILRDGRSHSGDPARLDSYHCWGRPVLAPAAGRVAAAVDGLPDQAIGSRDPANPAGNHVVLDLGQGEFAFLAHLQQGSMRVQRDQQVAAEQEIGLCGNSGNSSEPHLHFHLQTAPVLGEGLGLPAQFAAYLADGVRVEQAEPRQGQTVSPAP